VQVHLKHLIDEVQCDQTVRELRWPDSMACPSCESTHVIKRGFDDTEHARQRHECHDCDQRFDDLPDTIFAGHHHRGISQEKLSLYLGFSSSCTTCASGVKRYLVRSLSYWSHKTPESNKSVHARAWVSGRLRSH
jgi:transposase-like protein